MRQLLSTATFLCSLVAATASTTVAAESDREHLLDEIIALLTLEGLEPPASRAREAATLDELLAELRIDDPYVRLEVEGTVEDGNGFGLVFNEHAGEVAVAPAPGGPAAQAGLDGPGIVVAIDDRPLDERPFADVVASVQSRAAPLALDVVLDGGEPRRIEIERGSVPTSTIDVVPTAAGPMLRLVSFIPRETARAVKGALDEFAVGAEAIVLDLRVNPGGSIFEALDTASLFLPPGLDLATIRDADAARQTFTSIGDGPHFAGPLIVLVGPHTASAAEVFVRALRRYSRALVVGVETYGKCRSQIAAALSEDHVLWFSNLIIEDALGQDCEGRAIVPEIVVPRAQWPDTDLLIKRATAVLGRDGRPTSLCSTMRRTLEDIEMLGAQVRILFPGLDAPLHAVAASGGDYRLCIGPFAGDNELAAWQERLRRSAASLGNFEARPFAHAIEWLPE